MSKIIKLYDYEVVFTTSFEFPHGISGHTYELIDYFYISYTNGIKSAILLTDGTSKDVLIASVKEKYNFTDAELTHLVENTFECERPQIIMTNNVCVVDGSWRFGNCVIYCNNMFLLRCSETEFERFHNSKTIKQTHLLQDFGLYPERYTDLNIKVIHYVKKILWHKYHTPVVETPNTAMFYLTTNCRAMEAVEVQSIIDKYDFENYLIVTNDVNTYASLVTDKVQVEEAPVKNILSRFDTYIYTALPLKADCSPRFVVECAAFGKNVIYEIDYHCGGLERRKEDIKSNLDGLRLTNDDLFVKYVKECLTA